MVDVVALGVAMVLICIAMYVIAFACDSFEPAADYLGTEVYKLAPGVRGASIEAVASSLPELFTTMVLLFVYNDVDGFSAGIATCAGSALFNGAVIPAICILSVVIKGVDGKKVEQIALQRSTLIRDGFFFMLAEVVMIYFLNNTVLTWWMGAVLMSIYVVYAVVLVTTAGADDDDEGGETELEAGVDVSKPAATKDDAFGDLQSQMSGGGAKSDAVDLNSDGGGSKLTALLTCDCNELLFDGKDFATGGQAWAVLGLSTLFIALACVVLAEAVIKSAEALGIAPYFTAVILGAAASSVPDTIISYKDALKGDYDDAVANAIGSNIFDICFALGFPLFLYGLIYGDVSITGAAIEETAKNLTAAALDGTKKEAGASGVGQGEGKSDVSEIQSLRILLITCSSVMLLTFFATKTGVNSDGKAVHYVGKLQAYLLLLLYVVWTTVIVGQAASWWAF